MRGQSLGTRGERTDHMDPADNGPLSTQWNDAPVVVLGAKPKHRPALTGLHSNTALPVVLMVIDPRSGISELVRNAESQTYPRLTRLSLVSLGVLVKPPDLPNQDLHFNKAQVVPVHH